MLNYALLTRLMPFVAMFGAPMMLKWFADSWGLTAVLQQLAFNLELLQQLVCGQKLQVDVLVQNQHSTPVLFILVQSQPVLLLIQLE